MQGTRVGTGKQASGQPLARDLRRLEAAESADGLTVSRLARLALLLQARFPAQRARAGCMPAKMTSLRRSRPISARGKHWPKSPKRNEAKGSKGS
jgi:hypothetical protein